MYKLVACRTRVLLSSATALLVAFLAPSKSQSPAKLMQEIIVAGSSLFLVVLKGRSGRTKLSSLNNYGFTNYSPTTDGQFSRVLLRHIEQDPEVNDASSSHFFIFLFFFTTFSFFHSPRRSFLLVAPSSSPLLPPRPSFLLVPLSSSSSTVSIT